MRAAALALAVLCCFAAAAAGRKDRADRRERPVRAVWEWTLEERLADRFSPVSMAERRSPEVLSELGIDVDAGGRVAVSTALATEHRVNIISGARNPELFLPWELFNHLINTTSQADAEAREFCRRTYGERAEWLDVPEDFWLRVEAVTARFRAAIDDKRAAEALAAGPAPAHLPALLQRLERIEASVCAERAAALAVARAEFGGAWFDRFLYTAVTPSITIKATDETPEEHRWIEGGCR